MSLNSKTMTTNRFKLFLKDNESWENGALQDEILKVFLERDSLRVKSGICYCDRDTADALEFCRKCGGIVP